MPNRVSEEKRRFNVIDALIIVLVILCLITVFLRSQLSGLIGLSEETDEYMLIFKISAISATSFDGFLRIDDMVYLDSPDLELGTIDSDLGTSPTVVYMDNNNGGLDAVSYPDGTYVDAHGIIKCNGVFKEDGCFYLAGNYAVSQGDVLKVHTVGLDFTITVIDIG